VPDPPRTLVHLCFPTTPGRGHQPDAARGVGGIRAARPVGPAHGHPVLNGFSYPVQRAAAAVSAPEGRREACDLTDYCLGNANEIRERLAGLGWTSTIGGDTVR